MADIVDPRHEALVEHLFRRACSVLGTEGFELRPLRRRVRGRGKLRSYALGYTKLGEKVITIDLYTPRTMKTRKLDAILRVICHELAHHQAPPRIVRRWFHLVRMIHHPQFWAQCKKNVEALKKDEMLAAYFAA
jgi:predicted SprT family Zn-dependent metalloprotease